MRPAQFYISFTKDGYVILSRRRRRLLKCRDTDSAELFMASYCEAIGYPICAKRDNTNFEAYLAARFPGVK